MPDDDDTGSASRPRAATRATGANPGFWAYQWQGSAISGGVVLLLIVIVLILVLV